MASFKPKRKGVDLAIRTFEDKEGKTYLVFRSTGGSYHVFAEVRANEAGEACGGKGSNTRQIWASIWDRGKA